MTDFVLDRHVFSTEDEAWAFVAEAVFYAGADAVHDVDRTTVLVHRRTEGLPQIINHRRPLKDPFRVFTTPTN